METRPKRFSSCFPAAALLASALALPESPLRAQGEPQPPLPSTRTGAYTLSIEGNRGPGADFAAVKALGALGLNGGQALQSNSGVGLRIQSAGREGAMRLMGPSPQLTAAVQISLKAAFEGERAASQRPGQPQILIELTGTNDQSYEPRSMVVSEARAVPPLRRAVAPTASRRTEAALICAGHRVPMLPSQWTRNLGIALSITLC